MNGMYLTATTITIASIGGIREV